MSLYKCQKCGEPTDNIIDFTSDITGIHLTSHKCDKCDEAEEKLEVWQNEQYLENTMICPWCGHKYDNSDCIYDERAVEANCESCGKLFELETEIRHSWTTRKPENLFNPDEVDE